MRKHWAVIGLTIAVFAVASLPRRVSAQTARIGAMPQSIVGLGLVGAEAVILVEGAVGVRNPYILLGTGALGLVAGCIGGYFVDNAIDQQVMDRQLPMVASGILTVGLGLVIPTAIMYVSATTYRPEDNTTPNDDSTSDTPLEESTGDGSSEAPAAAGTSGAPTSLAPVRRRLRRPSMHAVGVSAPALFNVSVGRVAVGMPALALGWSGGPAVSGSTGPAVHVPVFSGSF